MGSGYDRPQEAEIVIAIPGFAVLLKKKTGKAATTSATGVTGSPQQIRYSRAMRKIMSHKYR
ncbi:MAG TPA: hypothetical protein PLM15_00140 [Methanothrix soehngenii]|nr:hypothetical protein [Methanothrix soehngenii]